MVTSDPYPGSSASAFAEGFLPRLGEYLLEQKLITSGDLQAALDFQLETESQKPGRKLLLGQALIQLGLIEQKVLDQAVATQFTNLHNALQAANQELEQRIQGRTHDLEQRLKQIRTAAEITQMVATAASLPELLQHTVEVLVDRFGFHLAAIYLVADDPKYLDLAEARGPYAPLWRPKNQKIQIGGRSLIGWCAANNRPRLTHDARRDFFGASSESSAGEQSGEGEAPRIEAAVPIAIQIGADDSADSVRSMVALQTAGGETLGGPARLVLGVLDVQILEKSGLGLDEDTVSVLATIAGHLAAVIQNIRLMDAACLSLDETNVLYRASQRLNRSRSEVEILQSLSEALDDIAYPTMLLAVYGQSDGDLPVEQIAHHAERLAGRQMKLYHLNSPQPVGALADGGSENGGGLPLDLVEQVLTPGTPFLMLDLARPVTVPAPLLALPRQINSRVAAFIPVRLQQHLYALVVVGLVTSNLAAAYPLAGKLSFRSGSQESESMLRRDAAVQTCVSICDQASAALNRVTASQANRKREAALGALNRISQFVTTQMDLFDFYRAIHTEVNQIIGEVSFFIALYNHEAETIQIPYLFEPEDPDSKISQVDPFPVGAGLTSILITTRKPLMLLEDVDRKADSLGAMTVGVASTKSWLGVPLLASGDVIGAMVVQDPLVENRFDEDDLQLMSILGSQVAIAIQTARLLASTRQQAERQRLINEITARIRSSNNRQTILETAAEEVRKVLGAARTTIEVGIVAEPQAVEASASGPLAEVETQSETPGDAGDDPGDSSNPAV